MIFMLFQEQRIFDKHMPHTPWYGWTTLLFIARYLVLPEIEHLGFQLLINQAVNPCSVPERSEQTGPSLGPALAKKKLLEATFHMLFKPAYLGAANDENRN